MKKKIEEAIREFVLGGGHFIWINSSGIIALAEEIASHLSVRPKKLTKEQADKVESEMRRLENDPNVTKHELRLFMQTPMPCGHVPGNLLTCDRPPFGCVVCNSGKD